MHNLRIITLNLGTGLSKCTTVVIDNHMSDEIAARA